ncbi:unnamed protein product [Linum trigynum]|uniref:Uncharacterized protein n=1 Tax=Linum trigynum TaxID=586398 RepID=A0AAV2CK60_9ROSI
MPPYVKLSSLAGPIHPSLGNIHLASVSLSSNHLDVSIPPSLSTLQTSSSSRNSLTRTIFVPKSLNLALVQSIDPSHNLLSGQIPTSKISSSLLAVKKLSDANFKGNILYGEISRAASVSPACSASPPRMESMTSQTSLPFLSSSPLCVQFAVYCGGG